MSNNALFHFLSRLAVLFLVATLLATGTSPTLAQQPSPGELTSQQPLTHTEPAGPAQELPWGIQAPYSPSGNSTTPYEQYVTVTWGDDAVHFLDRELNDIRSFPLENVYPNGIAIYWPLIFTGHFNSGRVSIYDFYGQWQSDWNNSHLHGTQALVMIEDLLAVYDAGDNMVEFFPPFGSDVVRSFPGRPGTEGLAYDGGLLWMLADEIIGVDPADGTVISKIPNAAIGCPYGGTGLAAIAPGQLVISCSDGRWYRVSVVDGSVIETGANSLAMYDLASTTPLNMEAVYMRSNVAPPFFPSNETAMNRVFGSGDWQSQFYETVVTPTLFSPGTNFIFMEGGELGANIMEAFLSANQEPLEDWVAKGGCLLLNAGSFPGPLPPDNIPSDGMSYGFGGAHLDFDPNTFITFSEIGVAVDPGHPIFNGPFIPAGTSFSGPGYIFSTASISGGGVTQVMTGTSIMGPNMTVPLAEKAWGLGHVAFGGMTPSFMHADPAKSDNLLANLIYYLTTFGCQLNTPPVARDDSVLFYENFENGFDNWTMTGLWNPESQKDTCGKLVSPFPSPYNAAYFGWEHEGKCDYDVLGQVVTGTLTLKQPIHLPSDNPVFLQFSSYEDTEYPSTPSNCPNMYDQRIIELSTEGGNTWKKLADLCNEGSWTIPPIFLGDYAGEDILLRFRFNTVDNIANYYFGWMVDDIAISTVPDPFGYFKLITDEDTPFIIDSLLFNDADAGYDRLSVASYAAGGLRGSLKDNQDGTFTYDPNHAFESMTNGELATEMFSYTVSDGTYTDTATVTILVTGLNDEPVALDDQYEALLNTTLDVTPPGVLGNDTDIENDSLSAVLVDPPVVGSLTLNPNGGFSYTPMVDFRGEVSFTYAVSDGLGLSSFDPWEVGFDQPDFPLDSLVDGTVVTTLDGHTIPPLSFGFETDGSIGNRAIFTMGGPGYTRYIHAPSILGPTRSKLHIDFGTDVNYAGFGFALGCGETVQEAITVTVYDLDLTEVLTLTADAIPGYGNIENWVEVEPGETFRSMDIVFGDDCGEFVLDNLVYDYYSPTQVTINVRQPSFFLPLVIKGH